MRSFKLLCFFLLIAFALNAYSQSKAFPRPYEINADTASYIHLPFTNWQYLEETGKPLSINEAVKLNDSFKYVTKETTDAAGTFWYRYKIKNNLKYPARITISGAVPQLDAYIADSTGVWKKYITGSTVPWSKKEGLKRINLLLYTIPANAVVTVYKRATNANPRSNTIGIADNVIKEEYIENDKLNIDNLSNAILAGILLLAALINLIFFGIVKERFYLYFALNALLVAFATFLQSTDLLFREIPGSITPITVIISCVASVFNLAFTRIYLDIKHISQKIDKALFILMMFFLASGVLTGFMNILSPALISLSSITSLLCILTITSLISIIIIKILVRRMPGAYIKAAIMGPLNIFPVAIFSLLLLNVIAMALQASSGLWGLSQWLINNNTSISLILSSWLIIGMSVVLFKRFQDLQNKIVYDALDRERFEREKEIERNQLITKQNEELEKKVEQRTTELSQSLHNLKSTQNQLIQSEKMASLGELTAGIAHEIQNPLNFVNNFSEVSMELVDEMQAELNKGDKEEAIAISGDIKQNLEKIIHHGKRADGIVKGMLQHSRASTGSKEPTDINALADEYLRLAFQGLMAKDKSFNAELITNFDKQLPKATIISQDIGRVLLNLYNNAFYATQQKQKTAGSDYKPTVEVGTTKTKGSVEIKVKDNGIGIPDEIKDKIMQPFFTSKPTGEGTGLGLSLSYDIVVKGHGGNINVVSKHGEGSEFTVTLPG